MPIDNNEKNGNNFAETVRLKNEEKKANDEFVICHDKLGDSCYIKMNP